MPGGGLLTGAASGAATGSLAGPIGAVAGGIIGAAGSYFSGKQSADAAEYNYKHRYQWQMKDLEKAGLNPMLVIGQSPPNVPQPNFPNIGEGAAHGAQAATGAYAARTAAKVAEAQIGNLQASSVASTAAARKANAEASLIETGGSAKQAAETVELGVRAGQGAQQIAKIAEEINALQTTNAQLERMLALERDVKRQTAASLAAGVPPKVLLGEIAKIGTELVRNLQKPSTKTAAGEMLRDTVNMLEDKKDHAVNAAKGFYSSYKDWMSRHGSAYKR